MNVNQFDLSNGINSLSISKVDLTGLCTMDWAEDEDEWEVALLAQLENLNTIKDLTAQQTSQALVIAVRQQNEPLAMALLSQNANPNAADEFGCTAVMFAATHGLCQCLEYMLAVPRCIINKRSHSMQTALHFAAKKGQVRCVESLINNGAMIDIADDWGETPLMLGVRAGCVETVRVLLDHGASLEMNNLRGMDAMMYAAQGGYSDIMELLIKKGCDVNKVVKSSPLHQAALFGHVRCIELLLAAGAHWDIRDIHGVLPIEIATQTDQHLVMKCLIKDGIPDEYKNLALAAAAKNNGIQCVKTLLCHGANPEASDMQGLPVFFWSVAQNNVEITKNLIKYNADVNKTVSRMYLVNSEFRELTSELDLDFVSAVVLAAFRDYCQLVQILVTAGADPCQVLRLWELNQLPQTLSTDASLISWLAHCNTTPRPLAFLCRQRIRESMSTMVHQHIEQLPLPKPIQDYLHYADLDQI